MPPSLNLALVLAAALGAHSFNNAHHPYARPHKLHRSFAAPAPVAPAPKPAPPPAVSADDEVEAVETVDAPVAPAAVANNPADHVFGIAPDAAAKVTSAAGLAALLGHLHAAMVHLPIAWVLLWAGVELAGLALTSVALGNAALALAVISVASFAPAVLSGLCRFDELASHTHDYETAEGLLHRNLMFVAIGLCALGVLFRLINFRWPNVVSRVVSFLLAGAAAVVTGYSAHLGGRMVYGADFLPF